jgi:hypothetical protein
MRWILQLSPVFLLVACGTAQHSVKVEDERAFHQDTKVEVGEVSNRTGETFDIDVEGMLRTAMNNALTEENLHSDPGSQNSIIMDREEFVRAGHPRAGVRRRAGAPHEAICVAAGAPAPPPSLLDQLAIGGRLVLPRGGADHQRLVRIVRQGERTFAEEDLRDVRFVLLVGAEGWPELGERGERKPPAQA